jgi:hypothetical protein
MRATNSTWSEPDAEGKSQAGHQSARTSDTPDAGRIGGRSKGSNPSTRPAAGSAPRRDATPGDRPGRQDPIVHLTIDLDDDAVIAAVANLLLDLTRRNYETG